MNKTCVVMILLALGAPLAAAELTAPGLPLIDAAIARAQPLDKEMINIGAAFPGMQTCGFKAVEGKTCVFTCKDGSTVNRPAMQSSLVPNGCAKFVMVPSGATKSAQSGREYFYSSSGYYSSSADAVEARNFSVAALKSVKGVQVLNAPTFADDDNYAFSIRFVSPFKDGLYQHSLAYGGEDEAAEAMAGMAENLSSEGKVPFAMEVVRGARGGYSFTVAYLVVNGRS